MARTCFTFLVGVLFVLTLTPATVGAQGMPADRLASEVTIAAPALLADPSAAPIPAFRIRPDSRPAPLMSLYASYAGFQAYDAYSTLAVLKHGGAEANPMMARVVGKPAAFIALKGATTAVSIYAAERLWRRNHRGAAVAIMVAANGMMAVVAARNSSVLRRVR